MAVTSYKNPGTLTSVDNSKANATTWVDPTNAAASDDAYATASTSDKDRPTYWLRCASFGFTSSDIPAGSTIGDIEVVIERNANHSGLDFVYDDDLFLRKTSGQVGTDHASSNLWPLSDAEATYTFTLADHGLTQADVVSTDFGCDFGAWLDHDAAELLIASVDCVKVRVNYTASARQPRPTPMTPGMVA